MGNLKGYGGHIDLRLPFNVKYIKNAFVSQVDWDWFFYTSFNIRINTDNSISLYYKTEEPWNGWFGANIKISGII